MIVFAVIAVIIVAVPVSFYELSSQPEQTISVVNDYTHSNPCMEISMVVF